MYIKLTNNPFYRYLLRLLYFTNPERYAKAIGVKIGKGTKFVRLPSFSSEPWLISIGENSYISSDVCFVTHDGGRWVLDNLYPEEKPFYKIGKISIGNNVFIGMKVLILPNVQVADNCVIGGGSVVTKNIPKGEVWAGVPARFVCTIEEYKKRMQQHTLDINWTAYWQDKEKEIKRVFEIE